MKRFIDWKHYKRQKKRKERIERMKENTSQLPRGLDPNSDKTDY